MPVPRLAEPPRLRIAQLANFVGPTSGGIKTAVQALGRGYADAGATRLLVLPGPRDERVSTAAGDVVQVRAPRVGGGYRLIVEPWRVLDELERFAPTSVEVSDKSTLLPVARWAARNAVPSVLFSHERLDAMLELRTGWGVGFGPPVALLNRALVRSFDTLVVTSRFAAAEFAALARRAETRLHLVPLGVDLQTFRPLRAPRGTSPGAARLVHVGRLSREKSPDLAVATALVLHERGVPVRLDVYGDGPMRSQLERQARGAPVVFHGHVPGRREVSRRMGRADVALSVCPGETFGLSVLEALASGTPVVTADIGGASELVDARSGASAVADPQALAGAVLEVLARPEGERRRAARERAEAFGWDRTVTRMLELHGTLATPRSATTSRTA